MRKVIFLHGFGVEKDARGLFTDIVKAFAYKNIESILFNLNHKNSAGELVVQSFSAQVERFKNILLKEIVNFDTLTLICHSQGCLIAAMADLPPIQHMILLAPPIEQSSKKTLAYFEKKKESIINVNGISKLARSDGTFTWIESDFWREKNQCDAIELYLSLKKRQHSISIVKALNDEVVATDEYERVFAGLTIHEIESDHNFTGSARPKLVELVTKLVR